MENEVVHIVSLSGGKDSTAMLLLMLENEMPIDAVLWADTGMEFPEMYRHIAKLDRYLYDRRQIHITRIKSDYDFEWALLRKSITNPKAIVNRISKGIPLKGYGWPSKKTRWCTGLLKIHPIEREIRRLYHHANVIQYIGIAADEQHRCKNDPHIVYPLIDFGISEQDALNLCYSNGFRIGGLYDVYHRASCWCCPLQSIDELQKLRHRHPELWEKLREMDTCTRKQFGDTVRGCFKQNWPVEKLERRFAREDRQNLKGENTND